MCTGACRMHVYAYACPVARMHMHSHSHMRTPMHMPAHTHARASQSPARTPHHRVLAAAAPVAGLGVPAGRPGSSTTPAMHKDPGQRRAGGGAAAAALLNPHGACLSRHVKQSHIWAYLSRYVKLTHRVSVPFAAR